VMDDRGVGARTDRFHEYPTWSNGLTRLVEVADKISRNS
jgi:hypothetical protein